MSARLLALLLLLAASPAWAQSQPQPAGAPSEAPLTLAELERLALEQQPALKAAAARVDAARARSSQAGVWPNPTAGFSAEELGAHDGDPRGEYGFFVEQPILLGGKLGLSRAVADRAADRADADLELQRARVRHSVRVAFYDVLTLEQRVAVHDRLAALISEAVGVTAQLFNVGAADRPDVLEAEVELRRVQLDVNAARNRVYAARERLAALAGDPRVASRQLAASPGETLPEIERDAALRRVLDESPQMRAARADAARAQAVTAAARRTTYPDLFLRGGAVYNRERGERSGTALGWQGQFEAGVSVPLFNRNTAGVVAARADELRAQADQQRLELALRAQFAGVYAEYLSATRASDTYRTDILPRAEEAYRLYLARYKEMAAAYPQVLVAQRRLLELSSDYLQSVEAAWQASIALQGLLAGDGLAPMNDAGADNINGDNGRGGRQ